jgi:hypothetical protein
MVRVDHMNYLPINKHAINYSNKFINVQETTYILTIRFTELCFTTFYICVQDIIWTAIWAYERVSILCRLILPQITRIPIVLPW